MEALRTETVEQRLFSRGCTFAVGSGCVRNRARNSCQKVAQSSFQGSLRGGTEGVPAACLQILMYQLRGCG